MKTEGWISALLICLLTVQVVLLGLLLLRISIIGQQTQALYNLFGVGTGPQSRIEEVVENVSTEGRPYKGSADAPVTIVEFSNFTCPACAMVQPALKELLVVREGQVGLSPFSSGAAAHRWLPGCSSRRVCCSTGRLLGNARLPFRPCGDFE